MGRYYGVFFAVSGKEIWPVVYVTWYGAKAFALYYGMDLPTEAEWECACRGGKQYPYGTDDGTINDSKANYNENIGHPVAVGSYPSNPYGLYDMSGNVGEWCHDSPGSYSSESVTNPCGGPPWSSFEPREGAVGTTISNSADRRVVYRLVYLTWEAPLVSVSYAGPLLRTIDHLIFDHGNYIVGFAKGASLHSCGS